jgi:periplasmic copper chaperone A
MEVKMKRIFASLLILGLASCGEKPASNDMPTNQTSATNAAASQELVASDARVRLAPNGMDMTAGYMNIANNGDKPMVIIGAQNDAAERVELHTHIKTPEGMMSMQQVEQFEIPAKGTLELAPNGAHLMMFGVKSGLKAGDETKFTIKIKDGADLMVSAKMVENPDMKMQGDSKGHQH